VTDLFGNVVEREPFKDIRNQRESVAEEKARLCQELNKLLRRTPKPSAIATIQLVTGYKAAHKHCLKVLQCKTSSRQELLTAVTSMRGWHGEPA
jgi:hypothetical protein